MDGAKTFDTIWVDGLLYMFAVLNFLSPCETHFFIPVCSVIRSVLPIGHIHSWYEGWRLSGWNNLPRPLQSVCRRHAYAIPPRRVGNLRGRHSRHIRVAPATAARQLPGVVYQGPRAVAERM